MEAGDLSPLAPMSIKDLIWVNVCQSLKLKSKYEFEKAKREAELKDLELVLFILADIRAITRDTNYFVRVNAVKGTVEFKKIKPMPDEAMPSVMIEKQREEEKIMANMTEEEKVIYRFNKGEKIVG